MDLEKVKEANPIEDVINAEFPLRGGGRYLRAEAHDSLIVDTHGQAYFWNSQGEQGDVITWVMRRRRCDFKAAVEWLCQRAGLPAPQWNTDDRQAAQERRARYEALTIAARHFVRMLRQNRAALDYCHGRGWTDETIQAAGLGFADGDLQALRGEFSMHDVDVNAPAAQAAMKIGEGMLVYPHVEAGRVMYLSARAIAEKRHYNPPVELIGERRVYLNWLYSPREEMVVLVEGQADAVTLGQWGIPAIALAGVSVGQDLLKLLARHEQVYLGLNQDQAGITATRNIADALGPLTRLASWPVKDANQWLQEGGTSETCAELLATAPTWVEVLAQETSAAEEADRERALRRLFMLVARLNEFALAAYRERLADALGMGLRQFNAMLKATREDPALAKATAAEDGGEPLITIELVGGLIGGQLCELIYQPPDGAIGIGNSTGGGKTIFAIRQEDGTITTAPCVDVEHVRYVPIPPHNRVLSERVVHFPTALGESASVRDLVRLIQHTIHTYVDVDVFYETLGAYYVLFSWLYDCFNTVPYLRALGDAGTGKSRLIQVVGAMCYRPIYVSGAATVSPIFRILDRYRGTLVLDEADFGKSDEAADIVKILNTGYQRTQGTVLRSGDRNAGFEPEVFVVYGPKVIATRKKFQDWALESRCLTKEMGGPTTREDIPIDLPMTFWTEEAPAIRNLLLRYRLQHWQPQIELDYAGMDPAIEPRLNQVTVALVTLIDDEDLREDLRSFIREYNRQMVVERGMTLASKVLEVLVAEHQVASENGHDPDLSLTTLSQRVNWLIDYENWGDSEDGRPRDKQVTPKKIGSTLRNQLHLRTERGDSPRRGYQVIWDDGRVDALRKRFGLDDEALVGVIHTLFEIEARQQAQGQQDELL
jgi:hypothetical protein